MTDNDKAQTMMNGRNNDNDDYSSYDSDSQEDDELLAQLRTAVELNDPPPTDLADRARRAFTWDAALEVLVEQERSAEAAPALRRNDGPQRRDLSYRLPTISLSLTIDETGEGSYAITGSTQPPTASVEIVEPDGNSTAAEVDRKGRFTATTWATSVVVQLTTDDGVKVRTPAIDLDDPGTE